ncbi:MAG: glycosyltransferase family 4 protein [Verrucomicrobiota bacterium]|jgi:glycosyltransferase involved in cell wall biosynthesis
MTDAPGKPHRLALVTGVLDLGGTTTFLCNLAGELIRRQLTAAVFSFNQDNPLASDFARLKTPVFTTDERRLIYEDRLVRVLRALARFQPTAVVANLSATSFEVLRYVPRGLFRLGMAQSHDPGVYYTVRPYAPHLDAMGAVSRRIQETLAALPEFARVPIHYLPYGVPMPGPETLPARDPGAPLRVLYLGRLQQEQKRVRLFPQMLQALVASGIPFHWTVAGEGPDRALLESAMKSAAPAQTVSFPGRIQYGDVPRVLSEHDVFLLASDYEGLPLSLLEAMARGLVPVISELPSGVGEVVDQTTGKLVPPDNVPGYAEAIIWLHSHRQEMSRLSRNAREAVRHKFSVAAMTDRWLAVLPPPPAQPLLWPERWTVQPILLAKDQWRFSIPLRLARRWLRRFSSRKTPGQPRRGEGQELGKRL